MGISPNLGDPGTRPVARVAPPCRSCVPFGWRGCPRQAGMLITAERAWEGARPAPAVPHVCPDGYRRGVREDHSMNFPQLSQRAPTRPPSLPISKLGKGAIGRYTHAHIHSVSCLPHLVTPVLFWGLGQYAGGHCRISCFFLWLPSLPVNSVRLCSSNRRAGAGHSWPVFIHFYPFKSVLEKGDSVVQFYLIGHSQRFPPFLNPKLQYMGIDPAPLCALSSRGPVVSSPLPPIFQQPNLSHPFTPKSNGTPPQSLPL